MFSGMLTEAVLDVRGMGHRAHLIIGITLGGVEIRVPFEKRDAFVSALNVLRVAPGFSEERFEALLSDPKPGTYNLIQCESDHPNGDDART
ncbi:hypothetical protein [Telmatospirillum siberiense]|nr:hypothetical protein [Telmatospirillum siberiense]